MTAVAAADGAAADCVLVALPEGRAAELPALLERATASARRRAYVALLGPRGAPATPATLGALARCLAPAARAAPTLDIVPLLPLLGHDAAALAALLGVERLLAPGGDAGAAGALAALNAARAARGAPPLPVEEVVERDAGARPAAPPPAGARILGAWPGGALAFPVVAVGGTFDRLHAGHRLLLAVTAAVATRAVFCGVTADKLLAGKRGRARLEPYAAREAAALDYMRRVNPALTVTGGPLADPAVPPLCATERDFDAIVVSEETVAGAEAINAARAGLGFPPLVVVVVPLLAADGGKLSSTDLRGGEAGGGDGGA
jgi:pantetheine-phosphate adenylyltransferase